MGAPQHFFSLDKNELADFVQSLGMKKFRANQLIQWVYERRIIDFNRMTNFSKPDRLRLSKSLTFESTSILTHQTASDKTEKLLLAIQPDNPVSPTTECVMIPSENTGGGSRQTACVSSQVGCPVGCTFCASGLDGLELNLTTGQIVEQIWQLNKTSQSGQITNVVFMGMGEPLSNLANVMKAVRIITAPWAFNLSARRVTISTVGLPAQIRRLADQLDLPVTLAISLHAPTDDLRKTLIPWAEYTSVDALIDAANYYFDRTGREVTLEYILLRDVNDRPEHARQLAAVAKRIRGNINLIRYNQVKGLPYKRPETENVHTFQNILRSKRVNVHIRASRGRDISGACGQLRHERKTTPLNINIAN